MKKRELHMLNIGDCASHQMGGQCKFGATLNSVLLEAVMMPSY